MGEEEKEEEQEEEEEMEEGQEEEGKKDDAQLLTNLAGADFSGLGLGASLTSLLYFIVHCPSTTPVDERLSLP